MASVLLALLFLLGTGSAVGATDRFTLTLNGEAVKDNRTGLVWEQAPDKEFDVWSASVARCATKTVGDQKAWRAPTKDELATLIEPDRNDPSLTEDRKSTRLNSSHVSESRMPSSA